MLTLRRFLIIGVLIVIGCLASHPESTTASEPEHRSSISPAPQPFDWDPACYKTYPQIEAFLQNTASQYPTLAALLDSGFAWEGVRHLYALKLTSQIGGDKPAILLIGGQHPRDIATTEVLLRLITHLAQSYGIDPDVTWLLDNRTVVVMPLANPDGYVQVVAGVNQFKNRNNNYCSGSTNRGADLNRNYPFQWNTVGTSGIPCDSSYPGNAALSEPESSAVIELLTNNGTDLVLNLQAPGPSILYPWGYTSQPPADADGLYALGWALGRRNGTPSASVRTHNANMPISGIIDDTAYGQFGIPAYTLNIGSTMAPTCQVLEGVWAAQRPSLLYGLKVAGISRDTTLSRSFGPDVTNVTVSQLTPGSAEVTGVLSSNYGTVAGAVYYVDTPGADGSGMPMLGNFGGVSAVVSATLDTSVLANGRHLVLVQGKTNAGQWGVLSSAFFTVTNPVFTPTVTPTGTLPTPTRTSTPSVTSTSTASRTPTSSPTVTPTGTGTRTPTPSPTTVSDTRTATPTKTPTAPTSTSTNTTTETPTRTPTFTRTPTVTRTATGTRTPSSTPTNTRTATFTRTQTSTRTPTPTRTVTPTRTPQPPNTATPLPCITFDDVYVSQYFYQAVNWLVCRSIVAGYPDNTFRPFNPATRAQLMKMVVLGNDWELFEPVQPTFSDVMPGEWHYGFIETGVLHQVIAGYGDGTFRPSNNITRGQLSKIIVSAAGWPLLDPDVPSFSDVPSGSTFYTYIETAKWYGVVSGYGDGTFHPGEDALRGQLSKMLYIALTQGSREADRWSAVVGSR